MVNNYTVTPDTDGDKCMAFRDSNSTHLVYSTKKQKQTRTIVKVKDFEYYLKQLGTIKDYRRLVSMNPSVNGRREKKDFKIPLNIPIDYDVDTPARAVLFTQHWGCNNVRDALLKCVFWHKSDKACVYFDYSGSFKGFSDTFDKYGNITGGLTAKGKYINKVGFHVLYTVVSDYFYCNGNYVAGSDDGLIQHIMWSGFDVLMEYFKNNGAYSKYDELSGKANYLDKAMCTVNQCFYSSNGTDLYLNECANIINYKLPPYTTTTKTPTINNTKLATFDAPAYNPSVSEINDANNKFCEKLGEFIVRYKKNNNVKRSVVPEFKEKLGHDYSNYSFYLSMRGCSSSNRKLLYQILKKCYDGEERSEDLSSFVGFENHLNGLHGEPKLKFSNLFKNLVEIIYAKAPEEFDLVGNRFDDVKYYTNHLGDIREEMYSEFDNNNRLFLSAPAGAGKTTLLMEYAVERLDSGVFKVVMICVSKNAVLDQIQSIIEQNYPTMKGRVKLNYRTGRRINKSDYDEKGIIVLSSSPKMELILHCDLAIVDESHNFVNYSDVISSNLVHAKKFIFISATQEAYLIWEENYRYIRVSKLNEVKKKIKLVETDDNKYTMERLIKGKKTIAIYWNNIKKAQSWADSYYARTGIKFLLMNKTTANEKLTIDTITDGELKYNYIIITSYFADGINFNNKSWDIMVMHDDVRNTNPMEIYQVASRFRLATPELFLLTKARPYERKKTPVDYSVFRNFELKKKWVDLFQDELKAMNRHLGRNSNKKLVSGGYFDKTISNKYNLKLDKKKLELFQDHFLYYYRTYDNVRLNVLKFYFDVEEFTVKSTGNDNTSTNNTKQNNEFFLNNYNIILDSLNMKDTLSEGIWDDESRLNDSVKKQLKENSSYFEKIQHRKNECISKGISIKRFYKKFILSDVRWKKFTDKMGVEHIGSIDNQVGSKILDGSGYYINELQENLYKIVLASGILKLGKDRSNNEYQYFSINDLVSYIERNNLWSNFRRNGEDLFLETEKRDKGYSISGFVNKIGRHFKKINKKIEKDNVVENEWVFKIISKN